jgi:hypothetical protein
MTSAQTLQLPGAGLPFFEIAWLRPVLKLKCFLMSQAEASELFQRETEKILELVQTTPIKQAGTPVLIKRVTGIEDSSRNWSLYMVLDHLRIVDDGIARLVEALTRGVAPGHVIRIKDVKPSFEAGPETIGGFADAVENYEGTVQRLGKLGRSARHAHPWFGPMTAHELHCLAGIHHGAHRQQIERIKKGLALQAG